MVKHESCAYGRPIQPTHFFFRDLTSMHLCRNSIAGLGDLRAEVNLAWFYCSFRSSGSDVALLLVLIHRLIELMLCILRFALC